MFFERYLADGGIALEYCTVIDDGHACAQEYNVVARGQVELHARGRQSPAFAADADRDPR